MKKYSYIERKLAKMLGRFPVFKQVAKKVYQRINYLCHREEEFKYEVHPQVEMRGLDCCWEDEGRPYFFGYYDKTPWSSNMSSMIMHRPVEKMAEIFLVYPDEGANYRLGASSAWNCQQGSMSQWLDDKTVAYNDVQGQRLGMQIINIDRGKNRFIPWPLQTVHPNGYEALSLNYKRLYKQRPEYGYGACVSNFSTDMPLDEDGLWRVNCESDEVEFILSLAHLRGYQPRTEMEEASHWLNHAMYSPEGTRIAFMHRWSGNRGKFSRLYVMARNGNNLRLLMDDRMVSHYSWRDENHLIVWGRIEGQGDRYYLVDVRDGTWQILGEETFGQFGDGHPSYAPGRRWIVTDTYPDKGRQRHLLLFDTQEETVIKLGRFFSPWAFDGPNRCDLHPRWSHDGKMISFDSAHTGMRKSYIVDVSFLLSQCN